MRYIEQHKLTEKKSGGVEKFLGVLFLVGLFAMMGIAGYVETLP